MSNLTAFRVYYDDGSVDETSMAAGVTLADAQRHFVGNRFEITENTFRTGVRVEQIATADVSDARELLKIANAAFNLQPRFTFREFKGFTDSYQVAAAISEHFRRTSVPDQKRLRYINKARELYQTDDCQIDDNATLSEVTDPGNPPGAWVASWVWVTAQELDLDFDPSA